MSEKTTLHLTCDFPDCEEGISLYNDSAGNLMTRKRVLSESFKDWQEATVRGWIKYEDLIYCPFCRLGIKEINPIRS